jgi:hypothetical protein
MEEQRKVYEEKNHVLPVVEEARSPEVLEAHQGVKLVEATHKVWGKYSRWALFIR